MGHTQGPWKVWGIDSEGPQILDMEAAIIARLDRWKGERKAEMHANADLIAAAPDLLAACEEARGFVHAWAAHLNDTGKSVASYEAGRAHARLSAAIAQARGQ